VLQTVGLRPRRIFQFVVVESTLLSTTGGVIGIGLGFAFLAYSRLSVAAEGVSIALRPRRNWPLSARWRRCASDYSQAPLQVYKPPKPGSPTRCGTLDR
jgi:hypothetical protein